MNFQNLLFETLEGGVCVLTLNRPTVLNAMNFQLKCELDDAVNYINGNPEIRAVVCTGIGEKAFSAGGDIHEMTKLTPEETDRRRDLRATLNWDIANIKVPTIGAINGLAYGGGALLASLFDIRIGCERTKFRFLAAQYGRLNSTWTLPMIVGWAKTKELIYTARVVEAEEALQMDLLNKLVPSGQLRDTAIEMAQQIAKNTPRIVQEAKALINSYMGESWRTMHDAEDEALRTRIKPGPASEGFSEFLSRKGRK